MKIKTSIYVQLVLLVAVVGMSAYYNNRLPASVPTHWNLEGKVDQTGDKAQLIFLGPGLSLFSLILTLALPKLSPKKYEIGKFESTFAYAMVLMGLLFAFLSYVILRSASGATADIGRSITIGISLFLAFLGNVLGKVRQNFYIGIRTPWTLASEKVWDATHRAAARLYLVGGIICAGLAILGLPIGICIGLILAFSLWPIVDSYLIYKRLS